MKKIALIILDGWGYQEDRKDNAIASARTPTMNALWNTCSRTLLEASGLAVGLPDGQMGNSEVGHTTIGAGTILDTDFVRISKYINEYGFEQHPVVVGACTHALQNSGVVHIVGLLGDGGVHAHQSHIDAMIESLKKLGIKKIALHGCTDGRDVAPQSAYAFMKKYELDLLRYGGVKIATLSGRYYAMDRDENWDRVNRAFLAMTCGEGNISDEQPSAYIERGYHVGVYDEHVLPAVFAREGEVPLTIAPNDAVVFMNFRPDRARMLARKLSEHLTPGGYFVTMTEYDTQIPSRVLFAPKHIETTLAREISLAGKKQVHIAETEKYAHATYFLNGGIEGTYAGEDHVLIHSRKDVKTHDEAPEMRAQEITNETIAAMQKGVDFLFVNYANPDMIGHTGNVPAIIRAIEEVDRSLSRVVAVAEQEGYVLLITADHGNAELNIDQDTGVAHTAHTTNLVPCVVVGVSDTLRPGAGLADIAPTILKLMDIQQPEAMTGKSLL